MKHVFKKYYRQQFSFVWNGNVWCRRNFSDLCSSRGFCQKIIYKTKRKFHQLSKIHLSCHIQLGFPKNLFLLQPTWSLSQWTTCLIVTIIKYDSKLALRVIVHRELLNAISFSFVDAYPWARKQVWNYQNCGKVPERLCCKTDKVIVVTKIMKINLIDKNVFKIGREWRGNKWIDSELLITYSELDM